MSQVAFLTATPTVEKELKKQAETREDLFHELAFFCDETLKDLSYTTDVDIVTLKQWCAAIKKIHEQNLANSFYDYYGYDY